MNVAQMEELIRNGLMQPASEPVFFVHPSKYGYQPTSTSYGVDGTIQHSNGVRVTNAKLEPSSR